MRNVRLLFKPIVAVWQCQLLTVLVTVGGAVGWGASIAVADGPETVLDGKAMTERIDALIDVRLKELGWSPAGPCNDADFIRRACLDLIGRPPAAAEVVQFMEDSQADKHARLIERLLNHPLHAARLAQQWVDWMLPSNDDPLREAGRQGLYKWLRERFAENLRYDRLVADLMTATGPAETGPTAFFLSPDTKPERIAARTARVFLGVQLDCAQCHDHPFARWTQRDFWGFAAYFAQIGNSGTTMGGANGTLVELGEGEVTLPDSDEIVPPKPLVAETLVSSGLGSRRQQLTLWMCAPENPMLARNAVNRIWALLFGRGLVEPLDDLRSIESASHPRILRELSDYFAATGYDIRNLIRVLANTSAYQRANRHPSGAAPEASYATMQLKPLTSYQMVASLMQVARQPGLDEANRQLLLRQFGPLRGDASTAKLGVVTALVTLHGEQFDRVSREGSSRLLIALNGPHMNTHKKIRWLFLATVNRPPTQEEMQALSADLQSAQALVADLPKRQSPAIAARAPALQTVPENGNSRKSGSGPVAEQTVDPEAVWLSDLLWALLNSTEFAMTP